MSWFILFSRCSVCLKPLEKHYYIKDKLLFCKDDYDLRFSQLCLKCEIRITGPVMVSFLFVICSLQFENMF